MKNEHLLSTSLLRLPRDPFPDGLALMKAITLHEPWAWLVAEGFKVMETRSWRPPDRLLGERFGVHAAKRPIRWEEVNEEIAAIIGELSGELRRVVPDSMPFGAMVATAELAGYLRVERHETVWMDMGGVRVPEECAVGPLYTGPCESSEDSVVIDPYGDYSVGRYIWLLDDIRKLPEPIPATGRQGFWNWKPQG